MGMVLFLPFLETCRIDQNSENIAQAPNLVVHTDQSSKAALGVGIGHGDGAFEKTRCAGGGHQ
jgi:hypothetical protein